MVHSAEVGRLLHADADADAFAYALAAFPLEGDAYRKHSEAATERARLFSRERCSRRLADVYERLDRRSRREAGDQRHTAWDSLLARVQAEWDLLTAKTNALIAATEGQPDTELAKQERFGHRGHGRLASTHDPRAPFSSRRCDNQSGWVRLSDGIDGGVHRRARVETARVEGAIDRDDRHGKPARS
ncbi:MAG: hypothetical protein U1E05_23090 [Patescibacteria group bacterium]|nr:hypothetical protein [Patescibacteria group bacterium]